MTTDAQRPGEKTGEGRKGGGFKMQTQRGGGKKGKTGNSRMSSQPKSNSPISRRIPRTKESKTTRKGDLKAK